MRLAGVYFCSRPFEAGQSVWSREGNGGKPEKGKTQEGKENQGKLRKRHLWKWPLVCGERKRKQKQKRAEGRTKRVQGLALGLQRRAYGSEGTACTACRAHVSIELDVPNLVPLN